MDDDYNFLEGDEIGDLPGPSGANMEKTQEIIAGALDFDGECVNLNQSGLGDYLVD